MYRDTLGRKAEADTEAKAEFNSLKNYFDGIEKDYATWSKPVSQDDTSDVVCFMYIHISFLHETLLH